MRSRRPVGTITRGTTNPNRLRRCDRWLAGPQGWRLRQAVTTPIVVDLGYGASPITAVELHDRLRPVRADVQVIGIEIDPDRVAAGQALARPGLTFALGGFEVPTPHEDPVTMIRAFNVLRQYAESEVPAAWDQLRNRLAPNGIAVDGTCDEIGRLATWVTLDAGGPVSLTLSWRLGGLDRPSDIAERLPKALIHHNVPGEPIHDLLQTIDRAWAAAAPMSAYGVRQRFLATIESVRGQGIPVVDGRSRWRLGELTVPWSLVAPGAAAGSTHQGP